MTPARSPAPASRRPRNDARARPRPVGKLWKTPKMVVLSLCPRLPPATALLRARIGPEITLKQTVTARHVATRGRRFSPGTGSV